MALADRLRLIREELYGEGGEAAIARQLGLPPQTWLNYEWGVMLPGNVMARFLILTGAEPLWLLEGEGVKYRRELSRLDDAERQRRERSA